MKAIFAFIKRYVFLT